MNLYCCGCNTHVEARLTDGRGVYPHRPDLYKLPFWECPTCKNFVGCHHKTKNRTAPLGCIPTHEIKNARMHIHRLLDPIWKNGIMKRSELYAHLSSEFGGRYHTAEIRSMHEAMKVYNHLQHIIRKAERERNE